MSEAIKAIKCELCGSNELVKQDDYFVCQFCGTKYTPEAAKKLIIELNNPIHIKGINNTEDDLNNVASLIKMEQLNKAETLLEKLSVSATNNPNVWIMYAKLSYAKYIAVEDYKNHLTYELSMSFNSRCLKCLEELHKYETFLIKSCPEDKASIQQIQELIQKVEKLSNDNLE